jgi:hypothetical protein
MTYSCTTRPPATGGSHTVFTQSTLGSRICLPTYGGYCVRGPKWTLRSQCSLGGLPYFHILALANGSVALREDPSTCKGWRRTNHGSCLPGNLSARTRRTHGEYPTCRRGQCRGHTAINIILNGRLDTRLFTPPSDALRLCA